MTGAALIDAVLAQGGFDTAQAPRTMVLGWLNEVVSELIARSKWRRASVAVGTTVIGQSEYPAPSNIVEADTLRVGTAKASRVDSEQLEDLQNGDWSVYPGHTVFAPYFSADGNTEGFEIFPTPSTAGLEIKALSAVVGATLADDSNEVTAVPADMHGRVVTAAIGLGRERLYATPADESLREGMVTALRERRNARLGGGVQQLMVLRRRR